MTLPLLIDFAAAALTGGVVGWITNALAISMLFKKYGKWGGVIEASYDEFIRDMSALVENDLVNHATLRPVLQAAPIKEELRRWIEATLKDELPAAAGATRLESIPGIEKSAGGLISLAEETAPVFWRGLFPALGGNSLADVLSREQYRHLVSAAVHAINDDRELYAARVGSMITQYAGERTLGALLPARAQANLRAALAETDMTRFNEQIDHALGGLYHALGLASLPLDELEEALNAPIRAALEKALLASGKDEVRQLGAGVMEDALEEARQSTAILETLIHPDLRKPLAAFFAVKIPELTEELIVIIERNRGEIEDMVNRAIDEQLNTTMGGIAGRLLKSVMTGNLAHDIDVCGKLSAALRANSGAITLTLNTELDRALQHITLGELITRLTASGLLNAAGLYDALVESLRRQPETAARYLAALARRGIFGLLQPPEPQLAPAWLTALVKQRLAAAAPFTAGLDTLLAAPLSTLVKTGGHAEKIPLWNTQHAARALYGAWDSISSYTLSDLAGPEAAGRFYFDREFFERFWKRYKKRELAESCRFLRDERVYAKTEAAFSMLIDKHLDTLLTGTVSSLVNNELRKLRPPDINHLVQTFMGSEMKSINILGGILGALAGILIAAASLLPGAPVPLPWWLYMLGFAAMGIATNALAITMLFRPYTPFYPGAKMPPFIGVSAARKPEFARLAGAVIQTKMLGSAPLTEFFTAHKERIRAFCFEKLRASDYALFDMALAGEQERAAFNHFITSAISLAITEHRAALARAVTAALDEALSAETLQRHIPAFSEAFTGWLKRRGSALARVLTRALPLLKEPFTAFLSRRAARKLQSLVTPEAIAAYPGSHFWRYTETHALAELTGPNFMEVLPSISASALCAAAAPLAESLEQRMRGETRIQEFSGGGLGRYLEEQSAPLLNALLRHSATGDIRARLALSIERALPVYALPWKQHIRPVLDRLLDEGAPRFIAAHEAQFARLGAALSKTPVAAITGGGPLLNRDAAEKTVRALAQSPRLTQSITRISVSAAGQLLPQSIAEVFRIFSINNLDELRITLKKPLAAVSAYIDLHIAGGEPEKTLAYHIEIILRQWLDTETTARLLSGLDIEEIARTLAGGVTANEDCMREFAAITGILLRRMAARPASYSRHILRRDLEHLFARAEITYAAFAPVTAAFVPRLNGALAAGTKDAILNDYLLRAALNAGERHLAPLIDAVDVRGVVEREISRMSGADIEKLFRGFAGRYFTKITFYGWIGAFGGLISYIISRLAGHTM